MLHQSRLSDSNDAPARNQQPPLSGDSSSDESGCRLDADRRIVADSCSQSQLPLVSLLPGRHLQVFATPNDTPLASKTGYGQSSGIATVEVCDRPQLQNFLQNNGNSPRWQLNCGNSRNSPEATASSNGPSLVGLCREVARPRHVCLAWSQSYLAEGVTLQKGCSPPAAGDAGAAADDDRRAGRRRAFRFPG